MSRDDDSMDVDEPLVRLKSKDGKRFTISQSEAYCSNALRLMLETNAATNNSASNEYVGLQSVDGHMLSLVIEWSRVHCKDNDKWLTSKDRSRSLLELSKGSDANIENNDNESDADDANESDDEHASSYVLQHEPELTAWDKSFLNSLDEEQLLRLTHAANYLDVRSLFSACCRTMAKRWEGKRVDELRKTYGIEGDFTSDEEHQMLQENKKLGLND